MEILISSDKINGKINFILDGNDGHDLGKDDHDIGNDAHDADNGDHSVIHIINLGVSCDLGNWLTLGGCLTGGGTWKVEGNEGTPKKWHQYYYQIGPIST